MIAYLSIPQLSLFVSAFLFFICAMALFIVHETNKSAIPLLLYQILFCTFSALSGVLFLACFSLGFIRHKRLSQNTNADIEHLRKTYSEKRLAAPLPEKPEELDMGPDTVATAAAAPASPSHVCVAHSVDSPSPSSKMAHVQCWLAETEFLPTESQHFVSNLLVRRMARPGKAGLKLLGVITDGKEMSKLPVLEKHVIPMTSVVPRYVSPRYIYMAEERARWKASQYLSKDWVANLPPVGDVVWRCSLQRMNEVAMERMKLEAAEMKLEASKRWGMVKRVKEEVSKWEAPALTQKCRLLLGKDDQNADCSVHF